MRMRWNVRLAAAAAAVLLVVSAVPGRADQVMQWNLLATDLAAKDNVDPLTESRWFAILHVAIHDGLNAVEARYQPYRPGLAAAAGASPEATVAQAAHDVLVELMPKHKDAFDAALAKSLAEVANADARKRGVANGKAAAAAALAERRNDGAEKQVAWPAGTKPGEYRPTPPDNTPAFMAQWGGIRPFVLERSNQFRPPAPPAIGGDQAKRDMEVVRRVGVKDGTVKTAEQSEIAKYWFENSTQGWNRVAREVSKELKLDPWANARLLALTNLAMADGFIAGFEAKYHYNYWRPVTALRENGEPEWLSDLWTPPVPDYPSTHTVLGAAAAAAIGRAIGTDFVTFSMTSGAPYPDITRKFWCLSEAAWENACSRILAGIHFPAAVHAGYLQGEQIGHWTADHALQPLEGRVATAR
jgi:hypothetical protein